MFGETLCDPPPPPPGPENPVGGSLQERQASGFKRGFVNVRF